jgi:hypothetical protein
MTYIDAVGVAAHRMAVTFTAPADGLSASLAPPSFADRLFVSQYLTAFDYVTIVVALIGGMASAFFYYQSKLLPSLKEMQPPSQTKLRATGLGIAIFAALLLAAPALPKGWILLLGLTGLGLAVRYGYQRLIAAILAAILLIFTLWRAGGF